MGNHLSGHWYVETRGRERFETNILQRVTNSYLLKRMKRCGILKRADFTQLSFCGREKDRPCSLKVKKKPKDASRYL